MTTQDDLLDQVADYADRLADSETLADTGSMATAAALAELYEAREWVEEWLEVKPVKATGGRPVQPDSRNRFAQWQAWKQEQRGRRHIQNRHTYRLLNAHEVGTYLSRGQISSEKTVRPLDWLRRQGLTKYVSDVMGRAVELAGSVDAVTSEHTRQALAEWKLSHKGRVHVAVKHNKAQADRIHAQDYVSRLINDGDLDELKRFNRWYAEQITKVKEATTDAA